MTRRPLTAFQFVAWLAQWMYWMVNGTANVIRDILNVRGRAAGAVFVLFCAISIAFAVVQSEFGWTWQLLSFEGRAAGWRKRLQERAVRSIRGDMEFLRTGAACVPAAAAVAAVTSVLVGPELAIAGLYLDASVETAPPGRCDFEQLAMSDAAPSGLQHSTHSNPAAISRVAAWLNTAAQTIPIIAIDASDGLIRPVVGRSNWLLGEAVYPRAQYVSFPRLWGGSNGSSGN